LGKELWAIGVLAEADASREAFRTLQTTSYIRYENLPLQTKTGECRDVEFVSNVYLENGHQVIQCNIRDISARTQAEADLQMWHGYHRRLGVMVRCATPPVRRHAWESAGNHCEARMTHVGSGAINVGRRPRLAPMIVSQEGCSIASPASNPCKPQQLS
jgi:hypothetical protein